MGESWTNIRSNRSRAYVNPFIVKCAASYGNHSSAAVPKKIHINPNFKGHRTFLQNEKTQEPGSVHVNPKFDRTKLCWLRKDQLEKTSPQLHHRLEVIFPADDVKCGESSEKKCKVENTKIPCQSTTCFSAAAASKSAIINTTLQQKKPQEVSQLIDNFGMSLDIRTRHKIIHGDNLILEANRNENSDKKLLNRYKLINIKKSKDNNSYKYSKNCQSLVLNLECNTVKEKKEKMFAEKLLKSRHILRRNSPVNKIANTIKTEYIHHNKIWQRRKPVHLLRNSKHKLDKRQIMSDTNKRNSILNTYHNRTKIISKNLPEQKRIKTVSFLWKLPLNRNKYYNDFIWRKQEKSENNLIGMIKFYPNRSVVKIGGIMYKASSNKLTRAKDKKSEIRTENNESFVSSKNKHRIVYVRGEKFLLDWNGKTIIRQSKLVNASDENKSFVKRIDLGGVTFIQKSNNVLIRTNTHQARQLVHSAKQRSIALLHHLRKRNNLPCMIYQRFGICRRHKKGLCIYVHDPKNIDLCKKFLKGECTNSNCLLSHDAIKEKMASCHFFLRGKCNKENCQYLHVKVNKKAVICKEFLQGFCDLGQNCTKRHIRRCPEFEENGTCSRGVNCPYPHKRNTKKTKLIKFRSSMRSSSLVANNQIKEKVDNQIAKKNSLKTKCESSKKKEMKTESRRFELTVTDEADSVVECIPKRVKLTDLPLFIPLKNE